MNERPLSNNRIWSEVGVNSVDKFNMFAVELHPKSGAGSVWGVVLGSVLGGTVFKPGLGLDVFVNLIVLASIQKCV